MFRIFKKKQPLLFQMFREEDFRSLLLGAGFVDLRMEEYFLWESIDRWIDTHETTPAHRQEISGCSTTRRRRCAPSTRSRSGPTAPYATAGAGACTR